jgi:hypothetical protein
MRGTSENMNRLKSEDGNICIASFWGDVLISVDVSGILRDWLVSDIVCKTTHKNYELQRENLC